MPGLEQRAPYMDHRSGNNALMIPFSPLVIWAILKKKMVADILNIFFLTAGCYIGMRFMILFVPYSFSDQGEINA